MSFTLMAMTTSTYTWNSQLHIEPVTLSLQIYQGSMGTIKVAGQLRTLLSTVPKATTIVEMSMSHPNLREVPVQKIFEDLSLEKLPSPTLLRRSQTIWPVSPAWSKTCEPSEGYASPIDLESLDFLGIHGPN